MNGYLAKRELIFFNPGKSGVLLKLPPNNYMTASQLLDAQEFLEKETSGHVFYIENRRTRFRRKQGDEWQPRIGRINRLKTNR